jgi:hypothetical protein
LRFQVQFSAILPKDDLYPLSVEDALAISEDGATIAVSDGASESFDSQSWARILTDSYVTNPIVNEEWLTKAAQKYREIRDPSQLSWSQQAAYERGSFATLLGLRVYADGKISCLSIGDCLAIFVHTSAHHTSWRYSWAREFNERPMLLSTKTELNTFINQDDFDLRHTAWLIKEPLSYILLMSDALAEWCLRSEELGIPACSLLSSIRNKEELTELVSRERRRRNMRVDDVTLMNLGITALG